MMTLLSGTQKGTAQAEDLHRMRLERSLKAPKEGQASLYLMTVTAEGEIVVSSI